LKTRAASSWKPETQADLRPPSPPPAAAELSHEQLIAMHSAMVLIRAMDTKMVILQRQGRIHFYGPITGQEAATAGSAYAMRREDWPFPALREAGVALIRGLDMRRMMAQCLGNVHDVTKGRQMPCHYVDMANHYYCMSSSVGSQIPHAVGAAYAAKIRKTGEVAVAYLGDGATSEGDFHAAMNFAGVWKAPVVFVCQNNQWSITVPYAKQTATPTIAEKAVAYGFAGVRCDGNDVLDVYETVRHAVEKARAGAGPTLVECLTYRVLGHTTSDDPTRYRDEREVAAWRDRDPVKLFEKKLVERGVLAESDPAAIEAWAKAEVEAALEAVEKLPPVALETLIEDVTRETQPKLKEQLAELKRSLGESGEKGSHHGAR
jgi:pyruvate dehydrogenase E1 component alpha subunit/2-oxoisovalerate dehydrogenase E1 component alpha subunit